MCGIAGIVKLDPWETVEEARLKQMRDVLRHRGPDGEGLWIDGPVGLAHRRLAIVDVAGGQQPMTDESGETWITYNGEIYNHPRLRPELEARGYRYRTRSDTETVLHMYRAEGEGFAERLQGMFALALWDRRRRRLGLVRDRLGIKPLYWTLTAEALLFASEIKALLAALPGRPAFNDAVLPEFLASGFVAGGDTFFTGVHALPPGHMLWWSPGEPLRPRRYWRLPAAAKGATPAEHAQQVRARLEAAVASHLMSDVPLGVFLSGGIDSSALCGLMARITREPVRAFSVAFADTDANELPWARLAARAAGAVHREVVVSPAAFFAALPRLIWHEDEPLAFPSSVPLYFVSRLARDYVKVVLTGEGADELFGGYNRYRVAVWNERLAGRWHRLAPGPLRAAVKAAARRLPGRAGRYAARTFLARADGVRDLYFDNFAVFPEAAQRRLLAEPGRLAARDPYAAGLACHAMAGGDPLDRLTRADIETYLVELLMKQDQMSMAASVESRVPFLDHDLVEHVVAMPGHLKLRGWRTKAVLREAVADVVPRAILDRRKMGFPVPVGRWLRQAHSGLIDDVVLAPRALARGLFDPAALRRLAGEHASGVADHGAGLWLLLNLELWQRIFLDGEDTAGLEAAA